MKRAKNIPDKFSPKDPIRSDNSGAGLAIGLSLGVLFGIAAVSIGLGMMLGIAVGLCSGPAVGAKGKNKNAEGQKDDDETQ